MEESKASLGYMGYPVSKKQDWRCDFSNKVFA